MKKIFATTAALLLISPAVFAAAETLEGGATPETAASFLSTYDSSTTLTLTSPSGATTSYFNGAGRTIKTLASTATTDVNIKGGFTMNTGSSAITAISFGGTGLNNQITFANGTYNVAGTAAIRFDIDSYITSATNTKAFIIASDATMNATGTSLTLAGPYLAGTAGAANSFTINGALNVYSSGGGYGTLNIYWTTKVFDSTTRGTRTNLNVDGGTVSAKDVNLSPFSFLNVKNGGTINSTGTFTFAGSANNQPGLFNLYANSTANLNNIVYYIGTGSNGYGMNLNVYGTLNATGTLSYSAQTVYSGALTSLLDVYSGGNAHIATVNLSSVGNVNVRAGGTFTSNTTTLGGTATIVSSGSTDLGATTMSGGTLTINSGATATFGATSVSGGTVTINGSASFAGFTQTGGTFALNGATFASSANSAIKAAAIASSVLNFTGGTTTLSAAEALAFTGTNTMNISSGATVVNSSSGIAYPMAVNGYLTLNVNGTGLLNLYANESAIRLSTAGMPAGVLTVNTERERAIYARKVTFYNASQLILNSRNSFASSATVFNTRIVMAAAATPTITVNKVSTFGEMYYQSNAKMTLTFGDEGVLLLTTITGVATGNSLIFTNFDNGKVFFTSMASIPTSLALSGVDIYGNALTNADFSLEAGEFEDVAGYWLVSSTVPEPAQWAAILGGIALMAAIYRRRK